MCDVLCCGSDAADARVNIKLVCTYIYIHTHTQICMCKYVLKCDDLFVAESLSQIP